MVDEIFLTPAFATPFDAGAANPAATRSSCSFSSRRSSLRPQLQFLHALRVRLTSQSSRLTSVGRSRSASVRSVDSSIVGVDAPEPGAEVVKAQRDALAAREVRRGSAADDDGAAEASIDDAGRLSESGTDDTVGFVDESCRGALSARIAAEKQPDGAHDSSARLHGGQSNEPQFARHILARGG